ncbi:MAG: RagB/SusD family nutrient uptake outer membrane protein [Sphingobacteriales bacterium]
MKRINLIAAAVMLVSLAASSCKKFLAAKPDAKLDVPSTLADFQALLDYYPAISNNDPSSGEISADDYYLFTADYLALAQDNFRNMYTWQKDNLFVPGGNEWFNAYRPAFTSNTILEGLSAIVRTAANQSEYDNVKGEALYVRAKAFLKVAWQWAPAYDAAAGAKPGIPVRLTSDFNQRSVRAGLQETFNQIISDFATAARLLPVTPLQVLRPSRPAAYAMLARTYLYMGDYIHAGLYADSCLRLYSTLLDYNTLNAAAAYPIRKFNAEVIQESLMITSPPISNTKARVDTLLYRSYAANDLRKTVFFKAGTNASHVFRGSYEGAPTLFGGVATDEVYLIRAECFARSGQTALAMADLNTLLSKRYKTGTFTPFIAAAGADALALILTERRKELLFRGLRWPDLKRQNAAGANINLTRIVNGKTYTLPANDPHYALPIPDDIIQLTGMQQNPR